jgi:hypothetical protein
VHHHVFVKKYLSWLLFAFFLISHQLQTIQKWFHIKWWHVLSQPDFEGSVRSPLTLSKMGLGSPPGLLKTQNASVGVKTSRIEAFFILLERSWSLDVQNGLAWAIWTSIAQVMVERRVGSQTASLTPDH